MGFTGHTEVAQCTYDPDQVRGCGVMQWLHTTAALLCGDAALHGSCSAVVA
jgi:hypothetical protein